MFNTILINTRRKLVDYVHIHILHVFSVNRSNQLGGGQSMYLNYAWAVLTQPLARGNTSYAWHSVFTATYEL